MITKWHGSETKHYTMSVSVNDWLTAVHNHRLCQLYQAATVL